MYYYYSDAAVDVGKIVYKWDILKAMCLKIFNTSVYFFYDLLKVFYECMVLSSQKLNLSVTGKG